MKRFVLLAVLATSACGNYSQEDLLFLAAIPSKEALALTPPGADAPADGAARSTVRQAADPCDDGADSLRCHARAFANGFNALTFMLLDIVDAVVQQPPTTRRAGKRIWGPFFLDDQGSTARFEMQRVDGGDTFRYCLHFAPGRVGFAGDDGVDCDVDAGGEGFVRVLSGEFTAGVDAAHRAKSGAGTMTLHVQNLPDRGGAFLNLFDHLTFTYDNAEGVSILVEAQPIDLAAEPLHYTFEQTGDGAGAMTLELDGNIDESETPAPEHLQVYAKWNADRAGRAEAVVTGGDVPAGTSYEVVECWDAELAKVYAAVAWNGTLHEEPVDGEGACVFRTSIVP